MTHCNSILRRWAPDSDTPLLFAYSDIVVTGTATGRVQCRSPCNIFTDYQSNIYQRLTYMTDLQASSKFTSRARSQLCDPKWLWDGGQKALARSRVVFTRRCRQWYSQGKRAISIYSSYLCIHRRQTNVPNLRLAYRHRTLLEELAMIRKQHSA